MAEIKDVRHEDSYKNMMNKYGTARDSSEAYFYARDAIPSDMMLAEMYESNGLFSKIVDRPAEEALKHGYDFSDYGDAEEAIRNKLEELEWTDRATDALKWTRLFGGALAVLIVDDGEEDLRKPLNWKRVRSIDEIRVFERPVVSCDSTTIYRDDCTSPFGVPEYYTVSSKYGCFRVHWTRCMRFRNGKVSELSTNQIYRDWGIPEYTRVNRALRETVTSHTDATKLLERSVQAVYKMKNLANLLATDKGEDMVIKRLAVIDEARGILNSIAIDNEGEDYDFKNATMAGTNEVLESTCAMLSAVTDIPQTILFGRSPSGMNSTGQSDFENYYNMVERFQNANLMNNTKTLLDLVLIELKRKGKIEGEAKRFPIKFVPLWSLSEVEQANLEAVKAQTSATLAGVASTYVDMQALDPSEVRRALAKSEEWDIQDVIDEGEEDYPEDAFRPLQSGEEQNPMQQMMAGMGNAEQPQKDVQKKEEADSKNWTKSTNCDTIRFSNSEWFEAFNNDKGGFVGMVFATLKKEGIDTKGMDVGEAIEKFNELKKSTSQKGWRKKKDDLFNKLKNEEDGTYDAKTGKRVELTEGYQVAFQTSESEDKESKGYLTDDKYDEIVEKFRRLTGSEPYVGKFDVPEISFTCKNKRQALRLAREYNQHSIWDNRGCHIIKNGYYDSSKNHVKGE